MKNKTYYIWTNRGLPGSQGVVICDDCVLKMKGKKNKNVDERTYPADMECDCDICGKV